MKSCTYCGREHPDEAVVCSIDGQPLKSAITPLAALEMTVPEEKHSVLGATSFVISTAVGCLMLGLIIVAGLLSAGRVHRGQHYPGQILVGLALIALLAIDVVAMGLGIASLYEKGKKRLFGILGVVFSSGTILGAVGLIVLGLTYARFKR